MFAQALARFASAADLVIHKLLASRPRDLEDARSILRRNPGLDRALVEEALEQLDALLPGRGLAGLFRGMGGDTPRH